MTRPPVFPRSAVTGAASFKVSRAAGALAALPSPFRRALAAPSAAPLLDGRDFALEIGPVPMNVDRPCEDGDRR